MTHAGDDGVNVECFVGQVYPQPSAKIVIITATGVVVDLAKYTNSSTVWQEGKFNQRNEVFLVTSSLFSDDNTPVLHHDDELKCEVTLQGTEYKEVLYRKLEPSVRNDSVKDTAWIMTILFNWMLL